MKDKLLYVVGGLVIVGLFAFQFNIDSKISDINNKVNSLAAGSGEQVFGGTTNFDSLSLSENLTVAGTVTQTGVATFTAAPVFNGGQLRSYVNTTSTADTTQTLAEADILNYDTVLMTPTVGATTITFPATSTLSSFLPNAGDMAEQCWHNASTTAGITLTFAAGTGMDLETASSSPSDLTILADGHACFKFLRKTNTDVSALMTEYTDAD